jgi:hypothetical protein
VISTGNKKDVVTKFVQNNGGCQFPCIFGIIPGVTDSQTVKAFIDYFELNSQEADNQINEISIHTSSNNDWVGTYLRFFENKVSISTSFVIHLNNDKVERTVFYGQAMQLMDVGAKKLFGDPYYDELLKSFSLSNILETYGQPEQIIIRPFPDDIGHPSPPAEYTFGFVLYYPEEGFVAEYIAVRGESGDNFVGCPTKSYATHFSSWNPSETISINESLEHFSNLDGISQVNISEYKNLQDVTSLSITDFYKTFKTSSSSECVQTPKKLWPNTIQ